MRNLLSGFLPAVAVLLVLLASSAGAEDLSPIALPAPQTDGGKPLMEALALRSTSRAFAVDPLPVQTLSNLLWAGWGINRPKEGKRTAPSARNWQETDVYVVMAQGVFVYDAAGSRLVPKAAGDFRALTGMQEFVKDAPITLVFVADTERMKGAEPVQGLNWAYADTGYISQNVYLFCASEGLATGVRAGIDRSKLATALKLGEKQVIIMAQCVGFPKR